MIKNYTNTNVVKHSFLLLLSLLYFSIQAQQDPQFTNYIHNLMSINSAYAGQRDVLSATALYRSQWVGLEGAPRTINFSIHSPLNRKNIGLGFNASSDQLGPATDAFVDGNFSYALQVNDNGVELSFGIKAGIQLLSTDFSLGNAESSENIFEENISLTSPVFGLGTYLHSENWFLGLSIPNVFTTQHYSDFQNSIASERIHLFLVGGFVYDMENDIYLKPSFLVKGVAGAPIIADISLSAFFENRFTLGIAYRWGDSFSGILGFQLERNLYLGYGYDATTSRLADFNSGSHEILLRYELNRKVKRSSCKCF